MTRSTAENRHPQHNTPRRKPSVDAWGNAVGAAVAIAHGLNQNEYWKNAAPDATKAFTLATRALLTPYLEMQTQAAAVWLSADIPATDKPLHIARVLHNGINRISGTALMAADVARDVGGLHADKPETQAQAQGLLSLAFALDKLLQEEVTGQERLPGDKHFMKRIKAQANGLA